MPRPPKRQSADHAKPPSPESVVERPRWAFWVGVTAVAALLRMVLLCTYAGVVYPGDHGDLASWGIQAAERGLLTLYNEPPSPQQLRRWDQGQWRVVPWDRRDRTCSYPPLAAYLLHGSGVAFCALTPDHVLNTLTSQALFSSWSLLADFLVAGGCAAIVATFRPPWVVRLTYAIAVLAPPLWWESIVWGQTTSLVLAPGVWMLYAMLRRHWIVAGVLWGIALGLKPQAILFVPLWGLALFVSRPRWRVLLGIATAAAALCLAGLPFMVHSGWKWLDASYRHSMFAMFTEYSTLNAHNVWYLDVLLTDSLQATETWWGIQKDAWGKAFLLTGLAAGFAVALWRWRRDARVLVFWSALSLLCCVMLPTKVHERYLLLVLPFLGVAAALSWRYLAPLTVLTIVVMIQMTWPLWLQQWPGQTRSMETRVRQAYERARTDPDTAGRPLPSVESVLEERLANYRGARAASTGLEWLSTLLALAATTLAALAFVRGPIKARAAPTPKTRPQSAPT